jgi:hypothetical protein
LVQDETICLYTCYCMMEHHPLPSPETKPMEPSNSKH